MNQGFFKNATIVLVAGVLLASAYALKKILQASPVSMDNQELSYEMPRARTETAGYSLAGRRVIRNIHSLPAKTVAMHPMNTAPVVSKTDPKAADRLGKKVDVKKAAAKTAQKKKPKVSVAVTNWNRPAMSGFQMTKNNFRANENMGGFAPMPAAQNGSPLPDEEEEEDTSKISAAQWRSLLFSQPSAKNGMDFLAAFQKKDVEESSFYQISEELMIDAAADRQKLGFELLKATPSVKSFSVMLNHYQEKTPEPLRSQLYAALKTYGEASRFGILSKLLYSSDARVVQTAQVILAQALASVQPNQNGQQNSGRDARSPGSTPVAVAQFNSFVPALRRLIASNDAALSQQAQTLLDSILALKPA